MSDQKPMLGDAEIDVEQLGDACEEYIDFVFSDDYNEDRAGDYENAIFEAAVEAFFGAGVWDKINARMLR